MWHDMLYYFSFISSFFPSPFCFLSIQEPNSKTDWLELHNVICCSCSSNVILLRLLVSHLLSFFFFLSLLSPHLMLLPKFALNCMPWIFYHSPLPLFHSRLQDSPVSIQTFLFPLSLPSFFPTLHRVSERVSEESVGLGCAVLHLIDLRCSDGE